MSAYAAGTVSPWQTCASSPPPPEGRINCTTLGNYVNNARLDYYVANVGSGGTQKASTHPINTRNGFGGGFFGDYTDVAAGSDNGYHPLWTDSNHKQTRTWVYGFEVVAAAIDQNGAGAVSRSIPER